MRFRIPGIRPASMSADEVRAVREARGWTVEQLADAVHASPLEVSAWEAGAVRVPPEQTERIRWFLDMDEWNAAVARARRECAWVGEHAPFVYEKMCDDVSGTWFAENVKVREHVMGCATCRAAVDLRDPRLWAGSAAVGVALGLIRARQAKDDAPREAPAPVPVDAERAALPGARPELDLGVRASAVRDAAKVE
jgi:transcriptional regulator with XRE-family HTH domain